MSYTDSDGWPYEWGPGSDLIDAHRIPAGKTRPGWARFPQRRVFNDGSDSYLCQPAFLTTHAVDDLVLLRSKGWQIYVGGPTKEGRLIVEISEEATTVRT